MKFLDKGIEEVLRQCIDNESTYPQILCDMLKQCNFGVEKERLQERISILIKEGYLSELSWKDDLPIAGRIESKGLDYFKIKSIYIRTMLRKNPKFSLSDESEKCLKQLLNINSNDPYIFINQNIGKASIIQDLADQGFIKLGDKGISYYMDGSFAVVGMILPKAQGYFEDKANYIEEILTFSQHPNSTEINISCGDNATIQLQADTVNSTQSIEFSYDLADEALDEILAKIDEFGLKRDQRQELLNEVEQAKHLVKKKMEGLLKKSLKVIYEFLKSFAFPILSTLIINRFSVYFG